MSKRIQWLDNLKGLAILLVMISHGCGIPVVGPYLYACYMPAFFIVSGYTFSWKNHVDTLAWIKGKAKRMLIPYVIYGIISVTAYDCLKLLISGIDLRDVLVDYIGVLYSRHHVFENAADEFALMSGVNAPLWFLTGMFVAWLLFILLYKANSIGRIIMLSLYLVVSGAMMYLPILLPWSIDTAFVGAIFIFVGYKIKESNIQIHNKPKLAIVVAFFVLIYILLVHFNGFTNMSIRIYGDKGIFSLPIFMVIGVMGTFLYAFICVLCEKTIIGKFLGFLGKNTITILGTHMFVFVAVNMVFGILNFDISIYVVGVIQLVASLVSVFIIKKIFLAVEKKIPIVKYL